MRAVRWAKRPFAGIALLWLIQLVGESAAALLPLLSIVGSEHAIAELPEVVLMLSKESPDADREEHGQGETERTCHQARNRLPAIVGLSSRSTAHSNKAKDYCYQTQKRSDGKK